MFAEPLLDRARIVVLRLFVALVGPLFQLYEALVLGLELILE